MMWLKKKYAQWLERKAIYFNEIVRRRQDEYFRQNVGYIDPTADIQTPAYCPVPQKVFLYENSYLDAGAQFVISSHTPKGRFILMPHAEIATNFTAITNGHTREIGEFFGDTERKLTNDINKDIIIEEDVWIGANVTVLAGVKVGRGAVVGAGCVCTRSIPPYAIVMGNPAKVLGFVFTPDEIIEHEMKLYPDEKRIRREILERNYRVYYQDRLEEIKQLLQ